MNRGLITVALYSLAVAACGKSAPDNERKQTQQAAPAIASKPLNEVLAGTPGFTTIARAIQETGLQGVFGGKAHYTLLAPTDAAFASLGAKGAALQQPEQRAALAALLRSHLVPGDVTAADIGSALDNASGKPLKLHAMDKSTLTLTREGGKVVVTAPDGAKAALTSDSAKARNGSAIGVDAVLKKVT